MRDGCAVDNRRHAHRDNRHAERFPGQLAAGVADPGARVDARIGDLYGAHQVGQPPGRERVDSNHRRRLDRVAQAVQQLAGLNAGLPEHAGRDCRHGAPAREMLGDVGDEMPGSDHMPGGNGADRVRGDRAVAEADNQDRTVPAAREQLPQKAGEHVAGAGERVLLAADERAEIERCIRALGFFERLRDLVRVDDQPGH